MAKKKQAPEPDFLADTISKIRAENELQDSSDVQEVDEDKNKIVDIMTFCERADLLDLPGNNLRLYLSQKVILITFYLGSRGNENVKLTEEEWNWLYEKQQNSAIEKIKRKIDGCELGQPNNFEFIELNLACGRRASKTLLASIICAYEAYKLIKLGDPYLFYNMPYDKEIAILNVANSQKQSGRLFSEIKARIRNSTFFRGRVQGSGGSSTEIRLYTDIDLQKKQDKNINIEVDGSIVLVCGHSNPDSLRGYAAICIIFDELQYYAEHPVISGTDFYNALTPSVAEFAEYGDGRTVEISTTGLPSGIFYDIHKQGQSIEKDFNEVLGYWLTTWDLNDRLPYNSKFLTLKRKKDKESFDVEFGARWATFGFVGLYFPEEKVRRAIKNELAMQDHRMQGQECFMHIDPAAKHDNYSVAIVTRKRYITHAGDKRWKVILVFHRVWKPQPGIGLNLVELDEELLDIARLFRPRSITFDAWNSVHSVNYLNKKGFYAAQLPFGRGPKSNYYQNLYDLMDRNELEIYGDEQIIGELLNLKYKPTARGVQIFSDPRAEIGTDDLADCLAGASWMAVGRMLKVSLPQGVLVDMGRR